MSSPLGATEGYQSQETPAPMPVVSPDPPAPLLPEPKPQVVEPPPNLIDSPQAHRSTLPVVKQVAGKLYNYVEPQPTIAKTPKMTSCKILEEPDSIQPRT